MGGSWGANYWPCANIRNRMVEQVQRTKWPTLQPLDVSVLHDNCHSGSNPCPSFSVKMLFDAFPTPSKTNCINLICCFLRKEMQCPCSVWLIFDCSLQQCCCALNVLWHGSAWYWVGDAVPCHWGGSYPWKKLIVFKILSRQTVSQMGVSNVGIVLRNISPGYRWRLLNNDDIMQFLHPIYTQDFLMLWSGSAS